MKKQSLKPAAWAASVALLALIAAPAAPARTQSCSALGATNIELSVSTKRNATGHWNITVDANSEQSRSLTARPRERGVEVTVRQRAAPCDSTDAVHLSATASVSSEVPRIPAGYEPVQGLGYYRLSETGLTWLDAVQACATEGAHLIVLNSDLEANVVLELFARKHNFKNVTTTSYVHIGFHVTRNTELMTVQGLPLNDTGYVKWRSGEPNIGTSFFCGTATENGVLQMGYCTEKLAYICEVEIKE